MERKSSKSILTPIFLIFFTSVQGQISKTFDPIDVFEIEYASRPSNLIAKVNSILAWFNKYK